MSFQSNRKSNKSAENAFVPLNVSIIEADSVITGSVKTTCIIRIDGVVHGDIYSEKKIFVGEHAQVHGDIKGTSIEIRGKIIGDIFSTNDIHLFSTAIADGILKSTTISVDEGAILNGGIHIVEH